MTASDDLETVLRLACNTGDRDRSEQAAMLRVAGKLDKQFNAVTKWNPRLEPTIRCLEAYDRAGTNIQGLLGQYPCTFTATHPSTCACQQLPNHLIRPGFFPTPAGGWSRLVDLVTETREDA